MVTVMAGILLLLMGLTGLVPGALIPRMVVIGLPTASPFEIASTNSKTSRPANGRGADEFSAAHAPAWQALRKA